MELSGAVEQMIRRFDRRIPLDEEDYEAIRALPFRTRSFEANQYLVREGSITRESSLLLSGLAIRHKETADGNRQIVNIHVPGDFVDLEGALLKHCDHNLQALTHGELATVPINHVIELIDTHPAVGRAMWIDCLVESAIYREWILNVGQRQAKERIGHILCEFARRVELAELGNTSGYEFPMTQEQLADTAGLTTVHVNRTLKLLEAEGYIVRDKRFIAIPDWERLSRMSGYNELYLHLNQLG